MRQFLSSVFPDKQGNLAVTGKDFRYLVQVLRLQPGEEIDVRLPDGVLIQMAAAQIQKKSLILRGKGNTRKETGVSASQIDDSISKEKQVEFWLFQFLTKPQKMDIIIRQATEAGVSVIVPVQSEFSVVTSGDTRDDRWDRIIREARQQSGSPITTKILPVQSLKDAIMLWCSTAKECRSVSYVLYEQPCSSIGIASSLTDGIPDRVAIVVGCEGGISETEIALMIENGFTPIHLATNILRAETAAIYGIASVRTVISEYSKWLVKE